MPSSTYCYFAIVVVILGGLNVPSGSPDPRGEERILEPLGARADGLLERAPGVRIYALEHRG